MSPVEGTVRVQICEDSRTYAIALKRMLEYDGSIEVVGVHAKAEAAIAAMAVEKPQLVTMDIELPGMNGLAAIELIMSSHPIPILVLSSQVGRGGARAAAALAAGALEAVSKDDLDLRRPAGPAAAAFRRRVRLLAGARVIRHPRARLQRRKPPPPSTGARLPIEAIGVVASTGGPQAIQHLLSSLPAGFPIPLLIVQHIASGFTEGLATWLDGVVPLRVRLAEEGTALEAGAWIAPEGVHLVIGEDGRLALDRHTPGLHRPSGDMLLGSIAERIGAHGAGVVLSGMGTDGARGIAALIGAGALTIAQDEESSAIYGMPKAAAEQGVELVLPLTDIAPTLIGLAGESL